MNNQISIYSALLILCMSFLSLSICNAENSFNQNELPLMHPNKVFKKNTIQKVHIKSTDLLLGNSNKNIKIASSKNQNNQHEKSRDFQLIKNRNASKLNHIQISNNQNIFFQYNKKHQKNNQFSTTSFLTNKNENANTVYPNYNSIQKTDLNGGAGNPTVPLNSEWVLFLLIGITAIYKMTKEISIKP